MTKARDTANLVATGVPNSLITLDAAEIPNISTDKLTSGTLANARVADLPTSKITSGTFADARIAASNVTQHVSATDLQPLKADITALALREATNEASAAFNLPNQFIETFTDDTNLLTQTTGDRESGYWSSSTKVTGAFTSDANTLLLLHGDGVDASTTFTDSSSNAYTMGVSGGVQIDTAQKKFGTGSILYDGVDENINSGHADWDAGFGTGDFTIETWWRPADLSGLNALQDFATKGGQGEVSASYHGWVFNMGKQGAGTVMFHHKDSGLNDDVVVYTGNLGFVINTWYHLAVTKDSTDTYRIYKDGVNQTVSAQAGTTNPTSSSVTVDAARDLFIGRTSDNHRFIDGHIDEFRISDNCRYPSGTTFIPNEVTTVNATGTLIQAANTVASAKTKVGGTMLYKDNAGTATLGTDLKIYFSCNNGGAWTEAASYNAITPVYSTGIKQVRLGETTCTSGTGVIYKAVWANQAAGSKETQLHGIGINY